MELSEQVGLFNTKTGRVSAREPPPLCTQQSHADVSAASVAVDLVFLAAEDHGASQDAAGHRTAVLWSARDRAGETLTYMRVVGGGGGGGAGGAGGLAACFSTACVASPTGLLMIKLQIFQALRQGELLLDSHSQQRVKGFLLVLCCGQLSLHLIQLGNILITTAGETQAEKKSQICSPTKRVSCDISQEGIFVILLNTNLMPHLRFDSLTETLRHTFKPTHHKLPASVIN